MTVNSCLECKWFVETGLSNTHLSRESHKTAHSSVDVSLQQHEWWHEDNKTCFDDKVCGQLKTGKHVKDNVSFFLRSVRCSRKTIIRGRVSDYFKCQTEKWFWEKRCDAVSSGKAEKVNPIDDASDRRRLRSLLTIQYTQHITVSHVSLHFISSSP